MTTVDIIRAWKEAEYRESLSAEQRAQLPENPAGLIELEDAELDVATGGMPPRRCTCGCGILTPQNKCG